MACIFFALKSLLYLRIFSYLVVKWFKKQIESARVQLGGNKHR